MVRAGQTNASGVKSREETKAAGGGAGCFAGIEPGEVAGSRGTFARVNVSVPRVRAHKA